MHGMLQSFLLDEVLCEWLALLNKRYAHWPDLRVGKGTLRIVTLKADYMYVERTLWPRDVLLIPLHFLWERLYEYRHWKRHCGQKVQKMYVILLKCIYIKCKTKLLVLPLVLSDEFYNT